MGKTLQVIGDRAYDQTRSYHPENWQTAALPI